MVKRLPILHLRKRVSLAEVIPFLYFGIMLKKIKARHIAVVVFTTIFGSYGTFMYLKNNSPGTLLQGTSYYHMFFDYESTEELYSEEDRMVDGFVVAFTNQDLKKLRVQVWKMTFVSLLLGIGLAFLFEYLNKRNEKALDEIDERSED